MNWYKECKLVHDEDAYTLVIYLKQDNVEFSKDFFENPKQDQVELNNKINDLVKHKFPNVKIKAVKLMIGAVIVLSVPFASQTSTLAASLNPKAPTHMTQAHTKVAEAKNKAAEAKKKAEEAKRAAAMKKAQQEAFKQAMKTRQQTISQLEKDIAVLEGQVSPKNTELKTILADLQSGAKILSTDQLNQLNILVAGINLENNSLKQTSATKAINPTTNTKSQNNALLNLDANIAGKQSRLNILKQLNLHLDNALSIARLATVPVPDEPTITLTPDTPTEVIPTTPDTTLDDTTPNL